MHKDNFYQRITSAFLLLFFFIYTFFSISLGKPIFGSDEYAYFISGKYINDLHTVYELDPSLQQLSNVFYFKIINLLSYFSKFQLTELIRIFHAAQYICAIILINKTFSKIFDDSTLFWSTVALLILPNNIYIYAAMPEIELIFLSACLCYLIISLYPRKQLIASSLIGLVIGAALLIKPHAIALLIATCIILIKTPLIRERKSSPRIAIESLIIIFISCYFSLIFLWKFCSHEWVFNPATALGLNFYGRFVQTSQLSVTFGHKLLSVLYYAIAHFVIIALIFAPAIIWCLQQFSKINNSHSQDSSDAENARYLTALFVLIMLIMHIAMVAWFTAGAAALNQDEAMRLHGRYLGAIIIFLPSLYFHAIKSIKESGEKYIRFTLLVTFTVCVLLVFNLFKIFPWDYPLLFSFFKAPNSYNWNYDGSLSSLGLILIFILFSFLAILIAKKSTQKNILFSQIFIIFSIGCIQSYNWMYSHTKHNRDLYEYSHAISRMLGENQFGKGVLVSDERYGSASYVLYGLENSPKVLLKNPGDVVNSADVEGFDWVLFKNQYIPNFDFTDSMQIGPFKFFPMNSSIKVEQREKSILKSGEKINFSFGENKYSANNLIGFNPQEPWGAWTSSAIAEIILPKKIQGNIKIKIFIWTIVENLNKNLNLKIGDGTAVIALSDKGEEYNVVVDVKNPSDRLTIESATFHPISSHRNMGVAISLMSIEH